MPSAHSRRSFLFGLIVALFFGKLVWLQVIKAPEFTDQAQAQRTSKIVLEPRRGTIYDRNGVVLATSVDATTIYVNPAEVSDPNLTAGILAQVLGGEAKDYLEKVTASDTYYSIIKRKADTSVGDEIRQLASERVEEAQNKETADAKAAGRKAETIASGIHYVSESRREYPERPGGRPGGRRMQHRRGFGHEPRILLRHLRPRGAVQRRALRNAGLHGAGIRPDRPAHPQRHA